MLQMDRVDEASEDRFIHETPNLRIRYSLAQAVKSAGYVNIPVHFISSVDKLHFAKPRQPSPAPLPPPGW